MQTADSAHPHRARNEWRAANPVQPLDKTDTRRKRNRVKALNRRSIKAFEITAKPIEYVLTEADNAKIKRIESSPGLGNRYYVAPDEVPMAFAALRPGQYLEMAV